jgi:hypothetical protein
VVHKYLLSTKNLTIKAGSREARDGKARGGEATGRKRLKRPSFKQNLKRSKKQYNNENKR